MNLKHLIQAYHFNKINAKIEDEINDQDERAGVIQFNEDINASYLLDEDNTVIAMNIFVNGITINNRTLDNQLEHTIQSLTIIQKTIELLGNTKKEEANSILNQLEMFSGQLKKKAVRFLDYIYKTEPISGMLMFSILYDELKEKETKKDNTNLKKNKKKRVT